MSTTREDFRHTPYAYTHITHKLLYLLRPPPPFHGKALHVALPAVITWKLVVSCGFFLQ